MSDSLEQRVESLYTLVLQLCGESASLHQRILELEAKLKESTS